MAAAGPERRASRERDGAARPRKEPHADGRRAASPRAARYRAGRSGGVGSEAAAGGGAPASGRSKTWPG